MYKIKIQSIQQTAEPLFKDSFDSVSIFKVHIFGSHSTQPRDLITLYTPEYISIDVHKWYPRIQEVAAYSLVQAMQPKCRLDPSTIPRLG